MFVCVFVCTVTSDAERMWVSGGGVSFTESGGCINWRNRDFKYVQYIKKSSGRYYLIAASSASCGRSRLYSVI